MFSADLADEATKGESPKQEGRISSRPSHVKAGAFLACWGSEDMDEYAPDSAVSRKAVEQIDSNTAHKALAA